MGGGDYMQTLASIAGNVLEWYDFALYGFFSDTIAQVFFPPSHDEHFNLIMSYIVFGGAFVVRPLGGLITGTMGDTGGRKKALVFSLFSMSVPTVVMAILPTYEQVGWISTALLVICRLVQGFSVGGQLTSSLIYTLETKEKKHWGYYGALINMAANSGAILGNLVGALIRTCLSKEQLLQWGWRAAFLTGVLIVPITIWLHCYGKEHHPNEGEYDESASITRHSSETIEEAPRHPLRESCKKENLAALVSSIFAPMLYGGGYYLTVVWMAVYMDQLIDPSVNGAFWVNLIANIFGLTLPSLFFGWLSDRYGRQPLMLLGAISVGVAAPFMVWIISNGNTIQAQFALLLIALLLSLYCGPFPTFLVETFPAKIRMTSASIGFNLGICISSGFAPAIATALVSGIGPVAPGFIYPVFAIMGIFGMGLSGKVRHQDGGVDENSPSAQDDLSTHLL